MVNADMTTEHRRLRIKRVGKILKWLSALALLLIAAMAILTFFIPVVSVGARYSDPLVSNEERVIDGERTQAQDPREHGNRIYLEMNGRTPEWKTFSYHPGLGGRSQILQGREWLARLAAFAFLGYGAFGACLFFRLFRQYEHGNTLTRQTASILKWIGLWMLGLWCVSILFQISKFAWDSFPNLHLEFDHLVGGLFVCLVAWIMEEGHQIAEEQSLTI